MHARGFVCYGELEATGKCGDEPIRNIPAPDFFKSPARKRPSPFKRFPVIGGRDSSEVARDPGLRRQVLHGGRKLGPCRQQPGRLFHPGRYQVPDVIHSSNRIPSPSGRNRIASSTSCLKHPESGCTCSRCFSAREEFPRPTGLWKASASTPTTVNTQGKTLLVKYHWHPRQGVASLTEEEAGKVQAKDRIGPEGHL